MTSKRDIKILTELIDLEDIKVISHRLHDGIGIILQTESKKLYSICPRCGTKSQKLHQNHRHIANSNNTFIRWFDEIIAYFDNKTTSGAVVRVAFRRKGINNKLKLIKRSAYGFRNFNNFRARCLLNWHFNY